MAEKTVYLSLGSNVGEREANLRAAFAALCAGAARGDCGGRGAPIVEDDRGADANKNSRSKCGSALRVVGARYIVPLPVPSSACSVQEETVERNVFGLEGVELDLGELSFGDFAPAIDAGFGFLGFTAVEAAEESVGVVARGDGAVGGTGQGFDGVAAQQFVPVVIEEIAGGKDVAPGDFAAVGHDDADDALVLQS